MPYSSMGELVVAWEVAWSLRCAGGLMGPSWRTLLEGTGADEIGNTAGCPWPRKIVYHLKLNNELLHTTYRTLV